MTAHTRTRPTDSTISTTLRSLRSFRPRFVTPTEPTPLRPSFPYHTHATPASPRFLAIGLALPPNRHISRHTAKHSTSLFSFSPHLAPLRAAAPPRVAPLGLLQITVSSPPSPRQTPVHLLLQYLISLQWRHRFKTPSAPAPITPSPPARSAVPRDQAVLKVLSRSSAISPRPFARQARTALRRSSLPYNSTSPGSLASDSR